MAGHARILLLIALLAAPALIAAVSATQPERILGPPRLEKGDFWEDATEVFIEGGTFTSTSRGTVVGIENVTVGNATYEAVKSTRRITSVIETRPTEPGESPRRTTVTDESTRWFRFDDDAIIRVETVTRTRDDRGGGTTSTAVTTYDPPCAFRAWPLEVGKTWTVSCRYVTVIDGGNATEGRIEDAWSVTHRSDVTFPGGEFFAFALQNGTASGNEVREWYAPEACNIVKSERYQGGARLAATTLTDHRCGSKGEPRAVHGAAAVFPPTAPASDVPAPAPGGVLALAAIAAAAALATLAARRRA